MHLPQEIQKRFLPAISSMTEDAGKYAGMIRPTTDPNFGDYQCNAAMPLGKKLDGRNPRDVATELVEALDIGDMFMPPTIAGPGFINLKVRDEWISNRISMILSDERVGVSETETPKKIIVDFSSPNVAKPMHVGHIRSTVIGDCLSRTLRFLGHEVVTDNHLGDWGTQFGIIIYGYKNFGDPDTVAANPVPELANLYRLVNQLGEYQNAVAGLAQANAKIQQIQGDVNEAENELASVSQDDAKAIKRGKKNVSALKRRLATSEAALASLQEKIAAVEANPSLSSASEAHPDISTKCLLETAKLHSGDAENIELWTRFLPHCKDEINRIYDRLGVTFDHTLGESFYHDRLPSVVDSLLEKGLASESEGAICVFLDQFDAPMIIRKKDGAYLYATTDLATLEYRQQAFQPDEILYVVDTRQGEHFDKLFAVAEKIGFGDIRLVHVNFGTVLGPDRKPLKTRSGTLIGLEGLLDDAVKRAATVVCAEERLARMTPEMDEQEQQSVAEAVGIGAIKYADLAHQRESDYKFNLDKMVAMEGSTSTYVQYSYARTQSILRRAELTEDAVIEMASQQTVSLCNSHERSLALKLLQFQEALELVRAEYAPNHLVEYLFEASKAYAVFNDNCPVLKAENESKRVSRLALVVLCGRVLRSGLSLLGIQVVPRM